MLPLAHRGDRHCAWTKYLPLNPSHFPPKKRQRAAVDPSALWTFFWGVKISVNSVRVRTHRGAIVFPALVISPTTSRVLLKSRTLYIFGRRLSTRCFPNTPGLVHTSNLPTVEKNERWKRWPPLCHGGTNPALFTVLENICGNSHSLEITAHMDPP